MLRAEDLRFAAGALLSALALYVVAHARPQATPVDAALPFVGVLVIALAWLAKESRWAAAAIEAAVPLLVVASMALDEERVRLLAFGAIVAAAFAVAAAVANAAGVALIGILLLRWIPFANVEIWREVVVLAGSAVVSTAGQAASRRLGRRDGAQPAGETPALLIAVLAVALVTPTHPGKALLYPFLVAAIVFVARSLPAAAIVSAILFAAAFVSRASLAPLWFAAGLAVAMPLLARLRVVLPAYVAAIALFALWPWSGIVARAMPRFLAAEPPSPHAQAIGRALAANESIEIAVPPGTKQAVVVASGANVARLRGGRVIGSVGDRPIRIGDVADFGFLRREQFFAARNPLPRLPLSDIRGYGQAAFLYGAGRIEIERPEGTLRIAGAPGLPADARLQVESVELK